MIVTIVLFVSLFYPSLGIAADLKKDILGAHNTYRRQVAKGQVSPQPAAANMMEMIWSDELAGTAEKWANQCKFGHDTDAGRKTKSFPDVGQNIYAGSEPKEAVKMWFEEYKGYTYNSLQCRGVCGHYTQIVWASSYAVGCANVNCEKKNGFKYKFYLVCNYAPPGNYGGEKPYSSGKACSSCPSGSKCNDGLCSKS